MGQIATQINERYRENITHTYTRTNTHNSFSAPRNFQGLSLFPATVRLSVCLTVRLYVVLPILFTAIYMYADALARATEEHKYVRGGARNLAVCLLQNFSPLRPVFMFVCCPISPCYFNNLQYILLLLLYSILYSMACIVYRYIYFSFSSFSLPSRYTQIYLLAIYTYYVPVFSSVSKENGIESL